MTNRLLFISTRTSLVVAISRCTTLITLTNSTPQHGLFYAFFLISSAWRMVATAKVFVRVFVKVFALRRMSTSWLSIVFMIVRYRVYFVINVLCEQEFGAKLWNWIHSQLQTVVRSVNKWNKCMVHLVFIFRVSSEISSKCKSSGGRKEELFRKNVEKGAISNERWKRSYFEWALKKELFRISVQEGAISEVIFFSKFKLAIL